MAKHYKAKEELIALIKALATKAYEKSLIAKAECNYAYTGEDADLYIANEQSKDGKIYIIALTERYFDDLSVTPMEYGKWYNLTDLTVDQIEKFINDAGFGYYHNVLWTVSRFEPDERVIKGGVIGKECTRIGSIYSDGTLKNILRATIGKVGDKPMQDSIPIWIKALE